VLEIAETRTRGLFQKLLEHFFYLPRNFHSQSFQRRRRLFHVGQQFVQGFAETRLGVQQLTQAIAAAEKMKAIPALTGS